MLKPKYILIMIAMLPQLSQAFSWQDLWFNKDQQGATLLKQSKNSQAAEKFSDSNWKGTAYYKDRQYEKAYNEFKHDNSATGLYNQANSLANMQKYQEAIDAYTQAQKLEKDYPDAQHNKEIVEKLLEQQKQSKDSKQDQNKQDKDKQNQDKQDPSKQDKDRQNQDKQDQNKQDKSSDKQQNSKNKEQDGSQQQQQDQQQKSEEKNKQQEQAKNQQAQNDAQKKQEQNKDSQGTKEKNKPAQQDKAQQAANSTDAAEKEKKAKEDAQAQAAKAGQKPEEKTDKPATAQMTPQQNYEQQQIKAELAKIPDDPGGLLRNKFIRDYERQKQEVNNNE